MNRSATRSAARWLWLAVVVCLVGLVVDASAETMPISVAVVKSWGGEVLPVYQELNTNWSAYGETPLAIDTSLLSVAQFTYADLAATGADVIWLSDPAGGLLQYSQDEINAIGQYLDQGHSILGTFGVFQHSAEGYECDNRGLATIFGLRSDIVYKVSDATVDQSFEILGLPGLFDDVPDPYVSSGYAKAQVPEDATWDASDLAGASLVAQTQDRGGVVTCYSTDAYHAIYVSTMVEYFGSQADTQFLYNALTIPQAAIPEPATGMLLAIGFASVLVVARAPRMARR